MMLSRHHIEKYLEGELTRVERHEFERRMLEDPFLSDAVEGLQMIKDQSKRVSVLDDLEQQMTETINRIAREAAKRRNWTIAASISIILVSLAAYFGVRSIRTDNMPVAQKVEKAVVADSVESKEMEEQGSKDTEDILIPDLSESVEGDLAEQPVSPEETTVTDVQPEVFAERVFADSLEEQIDIRADSLLPGVSGAGVSESEGPSVETEAIEADELVPEESPEVVGFQAEGDSLVLDSLSTYIQDTRVFIAMEEEQPPVSVAQLPVEGDTRRKAAPSQVSSVALEDAIRIAASPVEGYEDYQGYLASNLVYPQEAIDSAVVGNVEVEFTVGVGGEIINIQVVRGLGFGCDEEAVRLIREGPLWAPASQDGEAVESRVQYSVKFVR